MRQQMRGQACDVRVVHERQHDDHCDRREKSRVDARKPAIDDVRLETVQNISDEVLSSQE